MRKRAIRRKVGIRGMLQGRRLIILLVVPRRVRRLYLRLSLFWQNLRRRWLSPKVRRSRSLIKILVIVKSKTVRRILREIKIERRKSKKWSTLLTI